MYICRWSSGIVLWEIIEYNSADVVWEKWNKLQGMDKIKDQVR